MQEQIVAATRRAMERLSTLPESYETTQQILEEEFTKAGFPYLVRPFYLAISSWWNDMEEWTEDQT